LCKIWLLVGSVCLLVDFFATSTADLLLYKTMSYIPFGQDKAVIKTGNASIQVIHIVLESIPKLKSNRSLLVFF
jgi:hypothetical protein